MSWRTKWRLETRAVAGARVSVQSSEELTWDRAFWDRFRSHHRTPQTQHGHSLGGPAGAGGRKEKAAKDRSKISSLGDS